MSSRQSKVCRRLCIGTEGLLDRQQTPQIRVLSPGCNLPSGGTATFFEMPRRQAFT